MRRNNELAPALADALKKLGEVLHAQRRKVRLSRFKLAKVTGLCPKTIEHIETASRTPTRRTCLNLYQAGDLQIPWLYFEPFAGAEPALAEQAFTTAKEGTAPDLIKQLGELADVLRDRRHIARLSRLELAERIGVCDATIKNIEAVTHPPSRKTCLKLYVSGGLQVEWRYFEPFAGAPPTAPQPEDVSGFAALAPIPGKRSPPSQNLGLVAAGQSGSEPKGAGNNGEVQVVLRTQDSHVAFRVRL